MPLACDRFDAESGHLLAVQVPANRLQDLREAILAACPLGWGDYDHVSFETAVGVQRFRSRGGGRNAASEGDLEVPCVELRVFLPQAEETVSAVLHAVYHAHPYEEPVVLLTPTVRTLHRRGLDEDNPNRFWNRPGGDGLPTRPA